MGEQYSPQELRKYGGKRILLFSGTKGAGDSNTYATPVKVSQYKEGNFYIKVTAKAGTTPTLDVKIVSKNPGPGISDWFQLVAFTQIGDTLGKEMKTLAVNLGEDIALEITVGGTATPSYTFSVYGYVKI